MMLLVTKDLTKTYSRQQKTFEAVSHAGFSLQKGEMAVIREVSSWKSRSW